MIYYIHRFDYLNMKFLGNKGEIIRLFNRISLYLGERGNQTLSQVEQFPGILMTF